MHNMDVLIKLLAYSLWGGALCDDSKNGCVVDYVNQSF